MPGQRTGELGQPAQGRGSPWVLFTPLIFFPCAQNSSDHPCTGGCSASLLLILSHSLRLHDPIRLESGPLLPAGFWLQEASARAGPDPVTPAAQGRLLRITETPESASAVLLRLGKGCPGGSLVTVSAPGGRDQELGGWPRASSFSGSRMPHVGRMGPIASTCRDYHGSLASCNSRGGVIQMFLLELLGLLVSGCMFSLAHSLSLSLTLALSRTEDVRGSRWSGPLLLNSGALPG